MSKRVWQFNPHSGGRPVPEISREATRAAIVEHAKRTFEDHEIDVRFHAQFCYIDAYELDGQEALPVRDRSDGMQLCRLRFFGPDRWSLAVYSYAHERYEPSVFGDGEFFGLAVDGFDLAANLYLT